MIGTHYWRRASRWLRSRWAPQVLILHYHRVADMPSDPYDMCVAPRHFAEQLEIARRCGTPLSLRQIVQALRDGGLPRRAVAITFDDGYEDNLCNAKPLLERYNLSATVFVVSGFVGSEREFWWDELENLVLQSGELPGTLRVRIGPSAYVWELTAPDSRRIVFDALYWLLRPLPAGDQGRVLDALWVWAGRSPQRRPTHHILTREQVVGLAEGGLVEVGAHTVTHPLLAAMPPEAQRAEVCESRSALQAILGQPVTSFSYPHGSWSVETVAALRDAGFACACSSRYDTVWPGADPLQLPRFEVKNWDGAVFERRVREWLCD